MFYAESDIEVLYIRLFESTLYLRWWNWNEILCLYLHEKIVGGRNRFDHLVQKNDLFSLFFTLFRTISWNSYVFHFFVVMFWMHVIHPLRWVKFMAGVENGSDRCMNHEIQWSQPWRTPAMNFTHWTGQVTCIQIVATKKNEKYKNFKR